MIGPSVKGLNNFELGQIFSQCYTQLSMKVKPSMVKDVVNEIAKKAIGCRVYFDGKNYRHTDEKCKTFEIPDNFPHLEDAHLYVEKHHTVPMSDRLSCICYNKDTVILHGSHACADGPYLKMIVDHLSGRQTPADPMFKIHESVLDSFEKFYDSVSGPSKFYSTPVMHHDKPVAPGVSVYRLIEFPLEKHISGFTEHLMMSTLISCSVLNRKLTTFAIQSAVDSRRALAHPDWRNVNMNALTTVDAHIDENSDFNKISISELKRKLRKDLDELLTNGEIFRIFKDNKYGTIKYPNYFTQSLSNMGNIKTSDVVTDAMISTSLQGQQAWFPGCVSFGTHSVDGKIFRGKMFTSPYILTNKEADAFANAVKFAINNITNDMSIKEAYDMVESVYHSH